MLLKTPTRYPTSDALMVAIGATADIVRERAEDRF
jgi:hypothetical protein